MVTDICMLLVQCDTRRGKSTNRLVIWLSWCSKVCTMQILTDTMKAKLNLWTVYKEARLVSCTSEDTLGWLFPLETTRYARRKFQKSQEILLEIFKILTKNTDYRWNLHNICMFNKNKYNKHFSLFHRLRSYL